MKFTIDKIYADIEPDTRHGYISCIAAGTSYPASMVYIISFKIIFIMDFSKI